MSSVGSSELPLVSIESDESLLPLFVRGTKVHRRSPSNYEASLHEKKYGDASSAHEMAATIRSASQLLVCFAGLQASYLTWRYFQERVMTKKYSDDGGFPSSVFLVFGNRLMALIVALTVVYLKKERGERGALVETEKVLMPNVLTFAPCSFSNVLSSFAQYECLKYISFPMQVCTIMTILSNC